MTEAALQDVIAKQAIFELSCRYMRAQDRLEPDLHLSVFWEDAICDYGFFRGTPAEFVAFAQKLLKEHIANHHMIGQALIEVEGDVAFGEVYFQAFHRILQEGAEVDLFMAGRYVDRYEKRQGAWRIAHRAELIDWARTEPAADGFLATIPGVLVGARSPHDRSCDRAGLRRA
jgi:hypothetical protein